MAYEGWIEYNGIEIINLSRTVQLAQTLRITTVKTSAASVQWIQDELGGVDYGNPVNAPWYDPGYPASIEFAGIMPLNIDGLDNSTLTRTPIEYINDGGSSGASRNTTLPVVAKVSIVASTDRGAEYGKRWLDRVLRGGGPQAFCAGSELRYFRYVGEDAPKAHRRDVNLTRGTTILSKRLRACSSSWTVTFTLTADDSYEYGEEIIKVINLGGVPTGDVISSGSTVLIQGTCPAYDYTPVYDPLYPAMIPSPTAPSFLPAGWDIVPGQTFERLWARVTPVEPTKLNTVPVITLTTETEARMLRVSVWDADTVVANQCDPLFSVVVTYLPADVEFVIDGEQKASYLWQGFGTAVRRTDSLVYSPDAKPVQWTAFNDPTNLLVTLDIFTDSDGYEGDGDVRVKLALVPKSD